MNKADLDKLAGNPNFISGIYNYCDRWCERCQFTSRCFLYATEEADPDLADPEVRDITNEKFWKKLQNIFADTGRLIADLAPEEGVDFDSTEVIARVPENDKEWDEAEYDDLSLRCKSYALKAFGWLKREYDADQIVASTRDSTLSEDEVTIDNAVEVIRWYQFFIATKTTRAISGIKTLDETEDEADIFVADTFLDDESEDAENFDYAKVAAKSAQRDANGSAKVALVAIDRSTGAWRSLQLSLPEKAASIKPILIDLESLRRSVEARFPRARDFIRPGLDEIASQFVS
jgi:hypothetical protein